MQKAALPLAVLMSALALTACGGDDDAAPRTADGRSAEELPAPERTGGSITGMPDARPGQSLGDSPMDADDALAALPPDTAIDSDGNVILPDGSMFDGDMSVPGNPGTAGNGVDGMDAAGEAEAVSPAPAPTGPGPSEAVALVRTYFNAINGGRFEVAHALWADAGRASGQSPAQFADSFSGTSGLNVDVLEPGRIDPAAGSRYIEVPVAYTATAADGTQRRFVGAYTLRHSMVDGAGPEAGQWRIASADLREVQP